MVSTADIERSILLDTSVIGWDTAQGFETHLSWHLHKNIGQKSVIWQTETYVRSHIKIKILINRTSDWLLLFMT